MRKAEERRRNPIKVLVSSTLLVFAISVGTWRLLSKEMAKAHASRGSGTGRREVQG